MLSKMIAFIFRYQEVTSYIWHWSGHLIRIPNSSYAKKIILRLLKLVLYYITLVDSLTLKCKPFLI